MMTSGGKYVGAAVLARTSCHSGSFVLHAGCAGSLYWLFCSERRILAEDAL